MNNKLKIHLSSWIIIALILIAGLFSDNQIILYVSSFGFLALLSVIFVVSIPLLVKTWRNSFTINLLANRRWLGIYSFIFALIHVLIAVHFFFNWDIAKAAENIYRLIGSIALLILAAMAATSNNTSVAKLGRNWKRLHYLVYVALLIVVIHSFNIGAIFLKSVYTQAIVLLIIAVVIIMKVVYRKKPYTSASVEKNNEAKP